MLESCNLLFTSDISELAVIFHVMSSCLPDVLHISQSYYSAVCHKSPPNSHFVNPGLPLFCSDDSTTRRDSGVSFNTQVKIKGIRGYSAVSFLEGCVNRISSAVFCVVIASALARMLLLTRSTAVTGSVGEAGMHSCWGSDLYTPASASQARGRTGVE